MAGGADSSLSGNRSGRAGIHAPGESLVHRRPLSDNQYPYNRRLSGLGRPAYTRQPHRQTFHHLPASLRIWNRLVCLLSLHALSV